MTSRLLVPFLFLPLSLALAADPLDTLVTPYPGSEVVAGGTKEIEYAEYEVVLGRENKGRYEKTQIVPGRVVKRAWRHPAGRSPLEVFRNYEGALKKAGFQPLFTCIDTACGSVGVLQSEKGIGWFPDGGQSHYFAGKLPKGDGAVWASLHVNARETVLHFVKEKPMESGLVAIDAAALARGLADEGHVAVYGIQFDSDKADLKPSSAPAIAEIVNLLQRDPSLKILVVGHTDMVGSFESNLLLSKRRADAVVQELTKKHGIAPSRVRAEGVGAYVPVASNGTEEGRARNRRVDLVKQR